MNASAEVINGRYRLVGQVGAGGMGVVYEALDRLTGEHVALKRVAVPSVGSTTSSETNDARLWSLHLAREFQLLASLRHPNIISVLDYGIENQPDENEAPQLYYTMQLLTGGRSVLQASKNLSLGGRLALVVELLEALAYLHRRDILHRDLKPGNVLVDENDTVKVVDFGLAALRESETDDLGEPMGTLTYMAPELFRGAAASEASDLFAVGIIACEVLTGAYPFDRSTPEQTLKSITSYEPDLTPLYLLDLTPLMGETEAPSLDSLVLTTAPTLPSVIRRLLEKDPADRYTSASQVLADLAASGLPIRAQSADVRDSFIKAARLIGRDAELRQLRVGLADALGGKGCAFLVGGESGVGKSRLLNELRTYALIGGAQVLTGQAVEGGGLTYQLWRDPLRRLVLTLPVSDLHASIIKDLIPDIDALLERPIPQPAVIDGLYEQQRLMATIKHLVVSQPRPTLLILEDLQWGRESLNVLSMLLKVMPSRPLMIVGSYREEESPELPGEFPAMTPIRLEKLPPSGINSLGRSMIGDGVPPELLALLEHETGGNVLFVVEVVRTLADAAGSLDRIGGATLPFSAVTGGILSVLRRRLDAIPADARPMLEALAVAGREIDSHLLDTLWQTAPLPRMSAHPQPFLFACAAAAVIDVFDGKWRFAHDKLREVLLLDIGARGDLPRLSGIVAQGIEDAYPEPAERSLRADLLANHWRNAGDATREAAALEMAVQVAFNNALYKPTLTLAGRGQALVEAERYRHAQFQTMSALAHYALRQIPETRTAAHEALQDLLGVRLLDTPSAQRRAFVPLLLRLIYRHYNPFRTIKPENDERNVMALRLLLRLTLLNLYGNSGVEMAYYALLTANVAELVSKARWGERARFYATAAAAVGFSSYRLSQVIIREAKVMLQWTEDPDAVMYVTQAMGILAIVGAEWEKGESLLLRCKALAAQTGHVKRYQEAVMFLTSLYYYSSQWAKARASDAEFAAIARENDDNMAALWSDDNHARWMLREGHADEALSIYLHTLEQYRIHKDSGNLLFALGGIIKSYIQLGDLESARPYVEEAAGELSGKVPTNYGLTDAYSAVIEYNLMRREAALPPIVDVENVLTVFGQYAARFRMARARHLSLLGWCQRLTGDTRTAIRSGANAVRTGERYHMPYEEALACIQLAKTLQTGDRHDALISRAIDILTLLGATADRARVQCLDVRSSAPAKRESA